MMSSGNDSERARDAQEAGRHMRSELERRAREGLTQQATRQMMSRLSPEAFRALRAIGKMRNQSPEEALRDEIRGYIEDKLPLPDPEWVIRSMHERFYQLGYAMGTVKRWLRNRE